MASLPFLAPTAHDSSQAFAELQAPPLPAPQLTMRGVLLACGLWLLYACITIAILLRAEPVGLQSAVISQLLNTVFYALYSFPVWWLVVKKMDNAAWGWKLALHAVFTPFYAWVHYETMVLIYLQSSNPNTNSSLFFASTWIMFNNAVIYVGLFAVLHAFRAFQRLRIQEQHAAELRVLAQDRELAALKAQINPHFLFNTLNSISALVKRDPDGTREVITHLADMFRYALDSSKRTLVPLRDELTMAKTYLDIERHRFPDRLHVHIHVDSAVLDMRVPPMILQPLVENAVKHGIAPSEEGGTITVHIQLHNAHLNIVVEDTGVGLLPNAPPSTSGVGLANTDARLQRLYGPDAAIHTEPVEPHGFRVMFSLPQTALPSE